MSYLKFTLLILLVFGTSVFAHEFEQITLNGFKKEILSESQIRFKHLTNKSHIIHLQISPFDQKNTWNEKTFKSEVKDMLQTRKKMYEALGFRDVQFLDAKLEKYQDTLSTLTIIGNYKWLNKGSKYFFEKNIYYHKNFLQIKILSNADDINEEGIQNILSQINPLKLEVK
ncbi:MAG: hypothetical protein WC635_02195 [Bacteriovorax sp.]|jgi:hypothetical protein